MKKFYRDVLDYVGVTILLRGIGIISFLYVGKLLPPAEFGYFAMASVIVAVASVVAQFGAPGLIMRNFRVEGARTLINALPLAFLLWLVEALILVFFGGALGGVNEAFRATADHPYLVAGLVLAATFSYLLTNYLIISLRARVFSVVTMAKSTVYLGFLVAMVSFERSYLALLYATLTGDIAFIVFSMLLCRSRLSAGLRELFSLSPIRAMVHQARGGFVFLSSDVIALVQSQLARIVLSVYIPVAELGIYAFFSNIVSSLSQFPSAFQQAYTPRLVAAYQENPHRTGHLLFNLIPVWATGLTAGYVGVVAAGELGLYRLALRQDYLPHVVLLNAMLFVVVCGAMLQSFYFSYYVGAENRSIRTHAFVHLAVFATLQLLLIPAYGLRGAVIAEVSGSALQLASLLAINYRLLIVGSTPRDLGTLLSFVTVSTLLVVITLLMPIPWSALLYGLAGLSLVYGLRRLPHFRRVYASF